MQAALEIHESQFQSVHAPPRRPEIAADDYDEDSDWSKSTNKLISYVTFQRLDVFIRLQ